MSVLYQNGNSSDHFYFGAADEQTWSVNSQGVGLSGVHVWVVCFGWGARVF